MLGRSRRRRGGASPSKSQEPTNTGAAVTADAGQGAATGASRSQLVTRLDESATTRLQRMSHRLSLLEQHMETLEADVAKASTDSYE
ncbi:hypothetical protein Zm00014a_015856 [Zea mays]|uniref:Uncharacterized protein n=1 Tax=Zea mays TaxID=4577 RepID=A0A3L6E871_MAIZE|nr:hypothetical protein Zm00014a_015856 [Zea mays]